MIETIDRLFTISCRNEYDPLKQVLLCQPAFMEIREIINETQRHFAGENIDVQKAMRQHHAFMQTLKNGKIDVFLLPPRHTFPEQVFTRDIGFVIGKTFVVSQLKRAVRKGEESVLIRWLIERKIPFMKMEKGSIEGGDVLIDGQTIWFGDSDRTSMMAIQEIRDTLDQYTIHTIPFKKEFLHLDCVFNILSPDEALVYPKAFEKKEMDVLANRYHLIEVSEEEQFTLGTNVLSIGKKTVISLPLNRRINETLRKKGYTVIEVDISEIIKSGGSFRCITLPLLRK